MTWFHSFRGDHGFTFYGDQTSPAPFDKSLVTVVYVCVLVSSATLLATLGIRGKEKWSHALRASYAVAITSIILVCLMSHDWMEGQAHVTAPFVYRSNMHFTGSISVRIGLRSANITLDGIYMSPSGTKQVYYVEQLPWPDYGQERITYWRQLERGLPDPILRVMDFLTYDHGDLQWGKAFRAGGRFAWALLWTSFVLWLLSNLLLFSVVVYGAYLFFLSGLALVLSCVAYSQALNPQPLCMSFGDVMLKLEFGWSFWLAMIAGSLTTVLGILLIVTDFFLHQKVAEFFHLEKSGDEDDMAYKEDVSASPYKQRFSNDAAGGPAMYERRGSIFLEPERRQSLLWDGNHFNGRVVKPLRNGTSNHLVRQEDTEVKAKKMQNNNGSSNNASDTPISSGSIFRRSISSPNDPKPSLATLKEHRENHANERRSNTSTTSRQSLPAYYYETGMPKNGMNLVRTASHERFLQDTANSIRLRSENFLYPNSTGASYNSTNATTTTATTRTPSGVVKVVEAMVETPPEPERSSSSSSSFLTSETMNKEDVLNSGQKQIIPSVTRSVPSPPIFSIGGNDDIIRNNSSVDSTVFYKSYIPSRQASETTEGSEEIEETSPAADLTKQSSNSNNKDLISLPERQVSIEIE